MSEAHAARMDRALAALSDPTRRRIFETLAGGAASVGALASVVPVSRPAVSQHLAVLKAAGLVADRAEGARRIYRIDPQGLGVVRAWLDRFWGEALDAFAAAVEAEAAGTTTAGTATAETTRDAPSKPHSKEDPRS